MAQNASVPMSARAQNALALNASVLTNAMAQNASVLMNATARNAFVEMHAMAQTSPARSHVVPVPNARHPRHQTAYADPMPTPEPPALAKALPAASFHSSKPAS